MTILSIPESSFSVAFKMFDIDNNGLVLMHINKLDVSFTHWHINAYYFLLVFVGFYDKNLLLLNI